MCGTSCNHGEDPGPLGKTEWLMLGIFTLVSIGGLFLMIAFSKTAS